MKVTFQTNEDRILIKCVDDHFNIYKCVINQFDPFVSTFCSRNMGKMEKILKNYVIQEMDDHMILKVEDPVELQYILKKEKLPEGETFAMIIGKLESIEEEIGKLQLRTSDLEEQLENGVILPGYAGGVIPKDTTELLLGVKIEYNNPDFRRVGNPNGGTNKDHFRVQMTNGGENYLLFHRVNNNEFIGKSIKPVAFLSNLQVFAFHYNQETTDFTPLGKCTNLMELYFNTCNVSSLEFVRTLKKLQKIFFHTCPQLKDLNPLMDCPALQEVTYQSCAGVILVPNFPGNIKITK